MKPKRPMYTTTISLTEEELDKLKSAREKDWTIIEIFRIGLEVAMQD